ncbi:cytochrome P450 [Zhihengliuella sp.]|uniref:cytochrome P450 n=1 Tax=Zhihengliuella sp. TaxID=1954483 RepID=UPI002810BECA|nr:cytochrome P450 [Zhihengliuella sp.]
MTSIHHGATIPHLRAPDLAPAFLSRGYTFIGWHCDRLGTNAFTGRLLGQQTLFLRGAAAAELLYTPGLFPRPGALPRSAVVLLQDRGSVQTLEGEQHRRRKLLFTSLARPGETQRLADLFDEELASALPAWRATGRIRLHDEAVRLVGRAAIRWAGIQTDDTDMDRRAAELGAMVEHAGSVGPMNWAARLRRRGTEAWARTLISRTRHHLDASGSVDGTFPLDVVASHVEADGERLDEAVAAIELLNLLRPIVAVSRFIAFAAVALDAHPQWKRTLAATSGAEAPHPQAVDAPNRGRDVDDAVLPAARRFAEEVRRTTPFFPAVAGLAARDFAWEGTTFPARTRVMVDLYGTNHDPRVWEDPRAFDPDRFERVSITADNLVPQGAGEVEAGHRCPGEAMTLALIQRATLALARMDPVLPAQDLSVDLRRLPALPASGVILDIH